MRRHKAAWVWDGEVLHTRSAVLVDEAGMVLGLEALAAEEPASGLLLPGLVNAHAHLELSWLAGAVSGGAGSPAWVQALGVERSRRETGGSPAGRAVRLAAEARSAAARAAKAARDRGTAFFVDVSNEGWTGPLLVDAGLRGAVQVERLGIARSRWSKGLAAPADLAGVCHQVTAHSPISCSPALLQAVLANRRRHRPAPTVHCDEDPADRSLLAQRSGPWVGFHRFLAQVRTGHDWEQGLGRGRSGVAVLADAGVLGPHLGLVHLVAADGVDLDRVAESGATAVLCPRSNLYISGELPDLEGIVSREIPVAVGTDSLASSPDLDLLAEAAVLRERCPSVDPAVWLRALTSGGAALLGTAERKDAGRLLPGRRPGLLAVDLPPTDAPLHTLLSGPAWPRRWVA